MNWKHFQPVFEYEEALPDSTNAWSGHKYFAYDLLKNLEPGTVVELGTYKGTSFFSFCQAVKDFRLKTRLTAVDTWQGDPHSGFYGEEIYEHFRLIREKYYSSIDIHLIRKTFAEAVKSFDDDSIDVLHIDGYHTYESVRYDFETWLPKVSRNGVILFHDTHERRLDFGVYQLWEELKKKFPQHISFEHSHGLGVIFLNESGNFLAQLKKIKFDIGNYYSLFSEKEKYASLFKLTDKLRNEDKKKLEIIQSDFSLYKEQIKILENQVKDKDEVILGMDHMIQKIDHLVQDKLKIIQEKDRQVANSRQKINDIYNSYSWKVTSPLRWAFPKVLKTFYVFFPYGTKRWSFVKSLTLLLINPGKAFTHTSSVNIGNVRTASVSDHPGIGHNMTQTKTIIPLQDINFRYYEEQKDYSGKLLNPNVKILSYYLPQFHPTPENDEWHGKGFTEWTKVKSAPSLFYGHYQQHIPHNDIGYYILDHPDILKMQAEMMKKAGVHGQIFYHYWFSGKLILKKPAQMLLENKDITMPFCFCWANENWTKRWDGNELDILLKQEYSKEDALNFIQYLIPFFKDPRYIRIDDRPVLFIYRASSFPDFQIYRVIWEKECRRNEIKAPYLVTVLTRSAVNPADYQMDAGAERVLHDWTNGHVPEIKNNLYQFGLLNGSVLDYNEVADFYIEQKESFPFTYFRSLLPIWDNTARYHQDAYLVYDSTPGKFQEWLEALIDYTKNNLPEDRQFILINAWNEWAEGAHLEPDTRHGYGYLNSIGRALSGINYESDQCLESGELPSDAHVKIEFSPSVSEQLNLFAQKGKKMISSLIRSTIFHQCHVTIENPDILKELKGSEIATLINRRKDNPYDFICFINELTYFSKDFLENFVRKCVNYKTSSISPNCFYNKHPIILPHYLSGSTLEVNDTPGIKVLPGSQSVVTDQKTDADDLCVVPNFGTPNEIFTDEMPIVTTIIRFHTNADFRLLKNALFSLSTQENCVVQPYLAVQDLTPPQLDTLSDLIECFVWNDQYQPIIKTYYTTNDLNDLRSKMLNESLRSVKTKYVTFLDYDDYLFPHAYSWLIGRLRETNKAVSFGNVYLTIFNKKNMRVLERKTDFEYGSDYQAFLKLNHAPLHSFIIDLEKIDVNNLSYFDNMKYMEDYYLTLQIFNDNNTDWESLKFKKYIGDYIHCVDSAHTLALEDLDEKYDLITSPAYMDCENKINDLRYKLGQRNITDNV